LHDIAVGVLRIVLHQLSAEVQDTAVHRREQAQIAAECEVASARILLLRKLGSVQVLHLLIQAGLAQELSGASATLAKVFVLSLALNVPQELKQPTIGLHVVPAARDHGLVDECHIGRRKPALELAAREGVRRNELSEVLNGADKYRALDGGDEG